MNMIVILLINSIVSLAEFTLCGKIALYIIQAKVTSLEPRFLADCLEDKLRLVFRCVCLSCHGSFAPFVILLYHVHDEL